MKKNRLLATVLFACVFSFLMGISAYGATALNPYDNKATAQTVIIDNKFIDSTTKAGIITLKANTFAAGDVVTIIDSKKAKLGDITIEDPTKDYSLEVTTLTKKSGSIGVYVTPAAATYKVSKTVTIKYAAQKSPVVDPTSISIVGNADTDDVLSMTGIEVGDTVNVYAATAADTEKKTLAKGTSKGTSVAIKLGKNNISTATGIKVSITKKDCSESDKVLIKGDDLKYTAPPVTSDITSSYVIKSAALICGLAPKDIIKIYSADPTQYLSKYPSKDDQAALKAILIGTKTVGAKDSTVFITFKNSLSEGAKVYITKKSTGKSVTAPVCVSQETETPGTVNTYVIKNEALISALAPKDIISIYSADPTQYLVEKPTKADTAALKAILIGTKTVGAKDSYVLITFKSELSEGATVYITKKTTGQAVTTLTATVRSGGGSGGSSGGGTGGSSWASLIDKSGFDYDGMGIIKLSGAASGAASGDTYRYFVPDGISYFADPKVGDNVAGWTKVADGDSLDLGFNAAVAHSKAVYVAEVDASNIIVKCTVVSTANIADYTPATQGTLTGTVAIGPDQFIIGNPDVDNLINGQDRTFTITFDGGTTVTVNYPASSTSLKSQLVSYINAVIAVPGGPGVAQYDLSGHIQIISSSGGASSKVRVGGADAALFFGTSPTVVDGQDAAH